MKSFINTSHYHFWTDTRYSRALAHQADNQWDKGTYVRWTAMTGWSVLEMPCSATLDNEKLDTGLKTMLLSL
ncbi:hypothetical protein EXU57_06460 [Segetibacter sp. 3557_3]|uniref:hypothetical protein n=1 Tax=Segetibacter sp. 3557_3 TaxID=2547429 RepID=UPI001058CD8B|nr:hypothetical protein [Segetibacter sp. 3557_3]TDH28097.1 hypothetical protein EXU57_06460 [Segetibacter sp. 3557_3]